MKKANWTLISKIIFDEDTGKYELYIKDIQANAGWKFHGEYEKIRLAEAAFEEILDKTA